MKKKKVYEAYVTVEQVVDVLSDHEDKYENPAGEYYYDGIKAFNDKEAAEWALDEFHDKVPIGCLDDFEITTEVKEVKG
jgi:hypothetical protein